MPRPLTALAVLFLALLPARLRAAPDDEPKYSNKTLSEWLMILEGSHEMGQRRLALHGLGAAGDHSLVWRQMTNTRRAALLILEVVIGPAKSKKVLPAFVGALQNDPEESIRTSAAQGLGRISAKCRAEKQDFTTGRDALLAALRKDPSGAVREAAATAVGRLESADMLYAIPALIDRLKDDYPGARAAAADTLFRLGKDASEAVPALRDAVLDEKNERTTRIQAAQTLGKIGPPEANVTLPALQKVLADDKTEPEVRLALIEVLSKFGKDAVPAVALLGKLLTDENASVQLRGAAVAALEQLGPVAVTAVPALKKAAKDRDKFVRSMALRSFAKMGKVLGSELKDVIALLRLGTEDGILEVRLAAIETLGNLDGEAWNAETKDAIVRLYFLTGITEKNVRDAAITSHQKVVAALLVRAAGEMDTPRPSQLAAIKLFGELGADALGDTDKKAVRDRLEMLAKSTDKDVSAAAEAALKKLGS